MNIEFHYYITKYLALEAGFDTDEAEIIAYSSQFTDDNTIRFKVQKPSKEFFENYITQTKNILKPSKQLLRIYLMYHFLPGDSNSPKVRRRDGKMHLLITSPASIHADQLFYDSSQNSNLYIVGIAAHMMADTFSHQNFIGTFDEINAMQGVAETLIPNVGHADAGYKPDIPNLVWTDPRLIKNNEEVKNFDRLLLAAKKIYSNFLIITSAENNWMKVKKNLVNIFSEQLPETEIKQYPKQMKLRIEQYKEILGEFDNNNDYNPNNWFDAAINQDVNFLDDKKYKYDPIKDKFTFKKNYENSNWYKFQEAVKQYQRHATIKLRPIFEQLEIKGF
jgi:hypothetical protein